MKKLYIFFCFTCFLNTFAFGMLRESTPSEVTETDPLINERIKKKKDLTCFGSLWKLVTSLYSEECFDKHSKSKLCKYTVRGLMPCVASTCFISSVVLSVYLYVQEDKAAEMQLRYDWNISVGLIRQILGDRNDTVPNFCKKLL